MSSMEVPHRPTQPNGHNRPWLFYGKPLKCGVAKFLDYSYEQEGEDGGKQFLRITVFTTERRLRRCTFYRGGLTGRNLLTEDGAVSENVKDFRESLSRGHRWVCGLTISEVSRMKKLNIIIFWVGCQARVLEEDGNLCICGFGRFAGIILLSGRSRGSCSKASRALRRLCQTILVVWGRSSATLSELVKSSLARRGPFQQS